MKRRGGFTLIELLAASALAAMLVLVLLQVLASLGRTKAAFAGVAERDFGSNQNPWRARLIESLRWDIANAASMKLDTNRVTLAGHGALNCDTLAASHDPVTTVYSLEDRAGHSCLVRRQSSREGSNTNDPGWSELVCADVASFMLLPESPSDAAGALRVRIDGSRGPFLDELIVVK